VVVHKEVRQCHAIEVVAQTFLLSVVDEVYACVPSSSGKYFDLLGKRKIMKVLKDF
jgi:hypothetical protein